MDKTVRGAPAEGNAAWTQLSLGVPTDGVHRELRLLVNGQRVGLEQFHQALEDVGTIVFTHAAFAGYSAAS